MLSKFQLRAIKCMKFMYAFWYPIPIYWDDYFQGFYPNKESHKWNRWLLGNALVGVHLLACLCVILTQLFYPRPNFTVLHFCIQTTGVSCFIGALYTCRGTIALRRTPEYYKAINHYFRVEFQVHSKYNKRLFGNLKLTWFDVVYVLAPLALFIPYLIFAVSMIWNLDGPYWILEDIWPEAVQQPIYVTAAFLLIRCVFLVSTFLETTRAIYSTILCYEAFMLSIDNVIYTLTHLVDNSSDFFKYYSELGIIWNILEEGITRNALVAVSIFHFLCIQNLFIVIRGFGHMNILIYTFFVAYCIITWTGSILGLPILSNIGENIRELPGRKKLEMTNKFVKFKSEQSRINAKKAWGLRALKFSYGEYEPFCRDFARNIFQHSIDSMLSVVLMFDLNGQL